MEDDVYTMVAHATEGHLYKEKKSKFIGFAFPVNSEEAITRFLAEVKQKHPAANHHCYAWQLGAPAVHQRVNDDGEPNNSAGAPILGQIHSFGLTNTLVVVVRYFGGTKLGVGGLITAYKNCAQATIENAQLIKKTLTYNMGIQCSYEHLHIAMRFIKQHGLDLISQTMGQDCHIKVAVRQKDYTMLSEKAKNLHQLLIQEQENPQGN